MLKQDEVIMTPKQIRKVIEQEIQRHKKHMGETRVSSHDWERGFIEGMRQIKQLLTKRNFTTKLFGELGRLLNK
jgi:hypothetical protein